MALQVDAVHNFWIDGHDVYECIEGLTTTETT